MVQGTEYEGQPPFRTLSSYALVRDEKGEEMHKSKGNAIWFEDAAERMGADVMRWMYLRTNPANNLNFGWAGDDEIKRGFLSTLWNTYSFFVTYANIDGWAPARFGSQRLASNRWSRPELDRWALSELNQLVRNVTSDLQDFDSMAATRRIENFIENLSNWYVRRSRRRFWKSEDDADKFSAYETLWTCLVTLDQLIAPMLPFLAEEMYQNLVVAGGSRLDIPTEQRPVPESVHLTAWPVADEALIDEELSESIRLVQRLASLGRSARASANVKVRQPLQAVFVKVLSQKEQEIIRTLTGQLLEELNVKEVHIIENETEYFEYQVRPNLPVLGQKYGREVGRIQRALATAGKIEIAKAVEAGRQVRLEGYTLEPSELLLSRQGRPGYAAAEEGRLCRCRDDDRHA